MCSWRHYEKYNFLEKVEEALRPLNFWRFDGEL